MFKRLTALAIALTLSACATQPIAPVAPLRVATWNLEHLSEDGSQGCKPRTDADYAALRLFADRLNSDIVAFEEVESVKAAARVFDPTKYDLLIETRPAGTRFPCKGLEGRTLTRQAVGFAIRKDIPFERKADLTNLQLGNPDLRSGVDVIVRPRGRPPLRLLAVHLKSGCASGLMGDACATLQSQAPLVEAWINERANESVRFAVLGDFNRRLARAGDPIWADWDDGRPANADLSLAAGQRGPNCDPRFKEFIDHIVLDARASRDLAGFEELTYGDVAERPSDHCPVVALLK